MKATGRIRNISGDTAEIEIYSSIKGCSSCNAGNCSSCGTSIKPRTCKARNSRNLLLKPGSLVELHLPAGKTAAAFVRVIVMPLVLFFSAFAFSALLTQQEGFKIAAGFTGMTAGFAVNFMVSGKIKHREMPEITRIFR